MDAPGVRPGVIQDLDADTDPVPTWKRRWLMPLAGALVLAGVLGMTFVKVPTLRPAALGGPPPATGVRLLELPPGVATFQTRVAFSGITGLTQVSQNDGFRYLYRLPDGRALTFLEYPDRGDAPSLDRLQASAGSVLQRRTVRGVPAWIQLPADASGPSLTGSIIWIADGTFYTLSLAAADATELARLAEQLR